MNLESAHGDGIGTRLGKVFARAQASADPNAVHAALLGVYERAGPSRKAESEALHGVTTKKFGRDDAEPWVAWAAYRMRQGDATGARTVLDTARRTLPATLHAAMVVKFALLEYRYAPGTAPASGEARVGSQERGRTLFESLLTAAPRRLDLWSVFLDQETAAFSRRHGATAPAGKKGTPTGSRADDLRFIRTLFERVVSGKHSSKKMKFLLKKFAALERGHGDAAGLKRVQEVAEAYIASAMGGTVGGGGAADDDEDME
jgi:rRNA biogenesis protein RRP5